MKPKWNWIADENTEQADGANPRPSGTSGMPPADSASRAGDMPEASGDSSSGTFGKEMKTRRTALLAAVVTITIAGFGWAYLTPPAHWDKVTIGMSEAEVSAIIPEFDQPWGGTKADFKYEKRLGFTWRLAVGRSPTGVDLVEKELWITWPEMRRLWHTTKT